MLWSGSVPPPICVALWVSVSPWTGPSEGGRVTYKAQMWSYIRKDGEPVGPARRGACPPGAQVGPQVEGGVFSSLEPMGPLADSTMWWSALHGQKRSLCSLAQSRHQ